MTKYIAIFEVEDDCNIKTIDAEVSYTYESNGTYYGMREGIEFEKEKTGHWVNVKVGKLFPSRDFKCSECGNLLDFDGVNCGRGDANYCPNCGARMVSE